jgi:hypothetical protein
MNMELQQSDILDKFKFAANLSFDAILNGVVEVVGFWK